MRKSTESPKQALQRATAAQMSDVIKRSRAKSERQRAYDAGRVDERNAIVNWLRGMSRGAAAQSLPGVDRAECVALIADLIQRQAWLSVLTAEEWAAARVASPSSGDSGEQSAKEKGKAMAKSYEHRVEVSFVIPLADEEDPLAYAEELKKELRASFIRAKNLKVEPNWRGMVVRK